MKKSICFILLVVFLVAGCKTTTYRPDGYKIKNGRCNYNAPSKHAVKTSHIKRAKYLKKCR